MSNGFSWFAPIVVILGAGVTVPFIRSAKKESAGRVPVLSASSRVRTTPNRTWLMTDEDTSRRSSAMMYWLFVLFVAGHSGILDPLNGSKRYAVSETYRANRESFDDSV